MELPGDFWAFNFELTISDLFQQKLIPILQDSHVTVT